MPTYYVSNQLHSTHNGGTAQGGAKQAGGTPAYITLAADCPFTNNECNNWIVAITSGTGSVAQKKIDVYTAATKKAELLLGDDWGTAPNATSVYEIRLGDDTINLGQDFEPGATNVGPFRGIQAALNVVASGEDIHVQAAQSYLPIGGVLQVKTAAAAEARIRVIGFKTTPGDSEGHWGEADYRVTVNMNGTSTKCLEAAGGVGTAYLGYVFRNFRFTGATADCIDFGSNPTVTFINCRVDTNGGYGFRCSNNALFIACESIGNGTAGTGYGFFYGYNCMAIDCVAGDNSWNGFHGYLATLIGCTMYGIPAGARGASMFDRSNYAALIQGCTIDGESAGKGLYIGGGTAHLANNIITRCVVGVEAISATLMATGICNLYFGNTADRTNFPADLFGGLSDDPKFTDPNANDYTLQDDSPAIEAGWPTGTTLGAEVYIAASPFSLSKLHLIKALVANKRTLDLATGELTVLDDDGETELASVAVAEDGAEITLTPTVGEVPDAVDPDAEMDLIEAALLRLRVIDEEAGTEEVYAADGETLLLTLTKTTEGDVTTITPS